MNTNERKIIKENFNKLKLQISKEKEDFIYFCIGIGIILVSSYVYQYFDGAEIALLFLSGLAYHGFVKAKEYDKFLMGFSAILTTTIFSLYKVLLYNREPAYLIFAIIGLLLMVFSSTNILASAKKTKKF